MAEQTLGYQMPRFGGHLVAAKGLGGVTYYGGMTVGFISGGQAEPAGHIAPLRDDGPLCAQVAGVVWPQNFRLNPDITPEMDGDLVQILYQPIVGRALAGSSVAETIFAGADVYALNATEVTTDLDDIGGDLYHVGTLVAPATSAAPEHSNGSPVWFVDIRRSLGQTDPPIV